MHEANNRAASDTPTTRFMITILCSLFLGGLTRSKSETQMNFWKIKCTKRSFAGLARDRKYCGLSTRAPCETRMAISFFCEESPITLELTMRWQTKCRKYAIRANWPPGESFPTWRIYMTTNPFAVRTTHNVRGGGGGVNFLWWQSVKWRLDLPDNKIFLETFSWLQSRMKPCRTEWIIFMALSLVDGCRLHTNVTLFHTKSDCKALV